jgi:hypothetical protein
MDETVASGGYSVGLYEQPGSGTFGFDVLRGNLSPGRYREGEWMMSPGPADWAHSAGFSLTLA